MIYHSKLNVKYGESSRVKKVFGMVHRKILCFHLWGTIIRLLFEEQNFLSYSQAPNPQSELFLVWRRWKIARKIVIPKWNSLWSIMAKPYVPFHVSHKCARYPSYFIAHQNSKISTIFKYEAHCEEEKKKLLSSKLAFYSISLSPKFLYSSLLTFIFFIYFVPKILQHVLYKFCIKIEKRRAPNHQKILTQYTFFS